MIVVINSMLIKFKKNLMKTMSAFLSLVICFLFMSTSCCHSKSNPEFRKSVFSGKTDLKQSWDKSFQGGKIYFGNNLEWYILGRLQNNGNIPGNYQLDDATAPEGNIMVLYLNKGIDDIKFNNELYESGTYWQRPSNEEGAGSYVNSWKYSDIRNYLNTHLAGKNVSKFEEDYLTTYEKNMVLNSKVNTNVFSNNAVASREETQDKYYLPSGIWNTEFLSWGLSDIADVIPTDLSESDYPRDVTVSSEVLKYLIPVEYFAKGKANSSLSSNWTRSAHSNSKKAALVSSYNSELIFSRNVDGSIDNTQNEVDEEDLSPACAPICRLNIENLNFASYSSMFNTHNSITQIPAQNGLYLKNKSTEDDFKGHTVEVNNGILKYKAQSGAPSNCYMCLLLKDGQGNEYSASYPLSAGLSKEINVSAYESGYYWFEKELESGSRDVIASNPLSLDAQQSDLSVIPTGDYSVYSTLTILTILSLSLFMYYFSTIKISGGKKYE